MYTILTSCPPYGSQNVGDKLIEHRTKELVAQAKGKVEFLTIFREEPLEPYLDQINATRAVLMPGFAVRDTPMYPGTYRLVEQLASIRVPLIPVGANWNVYPGDATSRRSLSYSEPTVAFLKYVASQVEHLSCREYFTCDVLAKHGINNTLMTGDPAWYLLPALGKPMARPSQVRRVVFSPPLSPYYLEQAKQLMLMLRKRFASAELYCAFHLFDASSPGQAAKSEKSAAMTTDVAVKNQAIRSFAVELGYEVKELAGDVRNLDLYQSCDLHVGYECHAHLNFLSRRLPSVLIAEDARGVGFNDTLGVGGFTGFVRAQAAAEDGIRKKITSGYCTSLEELAVAPPLNTLHLAVDEFLAHELESKFRRYVGLGPYMDELYADRMRPFIAALP